MRKRLLGAVGMVTVFALSACGSSGGNTGGSAGSPSTTNPFENASWDKAGPSPSVSARMVCSAEARGDIAAALGIKAKQVTQPTWVRKSHLYSCDYVYGRGK